MNGNARNGQIVHSTSAAWALACAWVWIGSPTAFASDAPRSQTVNVRDLDLSKPAAVAQLYERLRAAATNVCKPYNSGEAGTKGTWDRCRDATLAYSVDRLDLPALTTYYSMKVGGNKRSITLARQQH